MLLENYHFLHLLQMHVRGECMHSLEGNVKGE